MGSGPPDGATDLLIRHTPQLKYDSRERWRAVSVALWTDSSGHRLERASGELLAASSPEKGEQQLSLSFLGAAAYGDGTVTERNDRIAGRDAESLAQGPAWQSLPDYADRVYGRCARGSDGRIWLSYWFFYPYNDYRLLGRWLRAGSHQGDWEMIQLRLDVTGSTPDLALYAQHSRVQARVWEQVERVDSAPVIYPARGCHACYFSPGRHWTGHWFDRADGRGAAPSLALEVIADGDPDAEWAHWPGRWGETVPGRGLGNVLGLDASSPHGPGHQRQWRDPATLLDSVSHHDARKLDR